MCLPSARSARNGSMSRHGACPSPALRGAAMPAGRADAHGIAPRAIRNMPKRRIGGAERLHLTGSRRRAVMRCPRQRDANSPWKPLFMQKKRGTPRIIEGDSFTGGGNPFQRGKAATLAHDQNGDSGRADALDVLGDLFRKRERGSRAVSNGGIQGGNHVEPR